MKLGIIPARYASTRFPAKPLADLKGKSVLQRVYEQAKKAKTLDHVVVATDHQEIFQHVIDFGGEVVMTNENHQSGTDRCYEALINTKLDFDYIINIQGDEPFIDPNEIDLLANLLEQDGTDIATLAVKIKSSETLFDPNAVKVVLDNQQKALYFSRSPIPFQRNTTEKNEWIEKHDYFKHLGIYGYRAKVLEEITTLSPSDLEKVESLEQLRWLENGYSIRVGFTKHENIGIDTPEDLEKARKMLDK
ncbi:3-deoxy-manno-octulosonate cytidylyltransferase [Sediminitomix flava]|uniref:3-deoxy-manno-octulosonate cytidylyltransferase n=1 Tax=Sediminitomix flava TaxID=379075 RepID=A0A315Z9W5_SEDFL|nr:3-deoxy-manno-octulosonate cytidylyltransferase [Sediminitomix flava]PWJ42366.1 3-deoxy-manno-octulosonate cytidylyltransferase (CMP-KDO synthetase) [Sediminitomix flava]